MSYQALARKWRPQLFPEVIGQEHVVSALSNALDQNRVHHAFLFTGTRGVGKTTLARIFAKALNCEKGVSSQPCGECAACRGIEEGRFIDLIEVDAASRTRVDDTRELLDNVKYTPTQGRFKVYLIDEVHMLSTHSFNALLKTLEEPPEHIKFLLATTDPQKLPKTILSRCIQFNLKALDPERIASQLEKILSAEGIDFEPAALRVLARSANGSVRDALSLLDQAIAFGDSGVREADVRAMLGMIDDHFLVDIVDRLVAGDPSGLLETVNRMVERAVDFPAALDEMLSLLHNVALYQASPEAVEWKGIETGEIGRLAASLDRETVQLFYQIALIGKRDLSLAPDPRTGFEMVLLRMLAFRPGPGPAAAGRTPPGEKGTAPTPADKQPPAQPPANDMAKEQPGAAPKAGNAVAEEGAAPPGFSLEEMAGRPEKWALLVERSGLGGMVKELAMNMAPVSVRGNTLSVTLEESHRRMCTRERMRRIEERCAAALGGSFKLEIASSEEAPDDKPLPETPAQRRKREQRQREEEARRNFENDQNVRELIERFDAEIVPGSVIPPETK